MPVLEKYKQARLKIGLLSRWTFWACVFTILVLSLVPPSPPMPSTGWDKANHALAFATLAFLAHKAWPGRIRVVLPSLLFYGALIECLQSFTPDRHAEWGDIWADSLGLLAGDILARLAGWLAPQRQARR